MIACGSANGSVHLMEVSENMTLSGKNDKAILNAVSKAAISFIFHFDFLPAARNDPFGNLVSRRLCSEVYLLENLSFFSFNFHFILSFFCPPDVGPRKQTREDPRRQIARN